MSLLVVGGSIQDSETTKYIIIIVNNRLLDQVEFFVWSHRMIFKSLQVKKQIISSASAENPYLDLDYSGYHKNFIQ